MTNSQNIANLLTGTTQPQRVLPALDPSYFSVDERDTSDLLAFAAKFAKALSYFNADNEQEGSWMNLLLSDYTVLTAYVMKTDRYMELAKFLDYKAGILAADDGFTKRIFIQQFFSIGFHIVLRINRWYLLSKENHGFHPFQKYLRLTIEDKGKSALKKYYELYFLLTEYMTAFRNEALPKMEPLDRKWYFEPFPSLSRPTTKDFVNETIQNAVVAGQRLFKLQDEIINAAGEFHQSSLQRKNIPPHIGLLLTFLDLYKYQLDDVNKLTGRHLNFYFKDILKFAEAGPVADKTYLTFQLAKGIDRFSLPAGAALSAGKDKNGQPIEFLTQKEIELTAGFISQVKTLFFHRINGKNLNGIYVGSLKKHDAVPNESWPVFGGYKSDNPNLAIEEESLGFAVSCPDLLLGSGERNVVIEFILDKSQLTGTPPEENPADGGGGEGDTMNEDPANEAPAGEEEAVGNTTNGNPTDEGATNGDSTNTVEATANAGASGSTSGKTAEKGVIPQKKPVRTDNLDLSKDWTDINVGGVKISRKTIGDKPTVVINLFPESQTEEKNRDEKPDDGSAIDKTPTDPAVTAGDATDENPDDGDATNENANGADTVSDDKSIDLDCFDLSVTTTKGWTDIDANDVLITKKRTGDKTTLVINVTFGFNAPSIVAYEGKIHGPGFDTQWPVCKVNFKKNVTASEFAFIKRFSFNDFSIKTTVKNAKKFVLQSDKGKLSPSIPFMPFGSNPKPQSNLYIGGQEFFVKPITCFELDIQWEPYPDDFSEYYKAYNDYLEKEGKDRIFEDDVFTANISLIGKENNEEGKWIIIKRNESDKIVLFGDDEFGTSCLGTSSEKPADYQKLIACDVDGLMEVNPDLPVVPQYSAQYRNAFYKFSFANPPEGFGNDLYPKVVSQVTLENATKAMDKVSIFGDAIKEDKSGILKKITSIFKIEKDAKKLKDIDEKALKDAKKGLGKLIDKIDKKKKKPVGSAAASTDTTSSQSNNGQDDPDFIPLPNKPYIPKINALSINYTSFSEWNTSTSAFPLKYYRVQPFGTEEIDFYKSPAIKTPELLIPHFEYDSYAYLGLEQVQPGDKLNLLVSITSQVNKVEVEFNDRLSYEYLTKNGWQQLQIERDGTYGFEQNGIVSFTLPEKITDEADGMQAGLYWLRIGNKTNKLITTDFMGIQAAVAVRNVSGQNDFQLIKAGAIKKTANSVPPIKKILQPVPSEGGRAAETDNQFYHRTAYRLNNKKRAANLKDIENLVLEQFPSIYRTAAIPMGYFPKGKPGLVQIMVVPFMQQDSQTKLRPLAAPSQLRDVIEFVQGITSEGMMLEVVNPSFVEVTVAVEVIFNSDATESFLKAELTQDLDNYLSPWVWDNQLANTQDKYWNSAAIFSFIKSRPYIKYAGGFSTSLKRVDFHPNENMADQEKTEEVLQLMPWNLVVPAGKYTISKAGATGTVGQRKKILDLKKTIQSN